MSQTVNPPFLPSRNETLLETDVCDNMHKKIAFRLSPKAHLFSVGGVGGIGLDIL